MPNIDLLFKSTPAASANLVFGAEDAVGSAEFQLVATLPPLSVSLKIIPDVDATISATLPGLSVSVSAEYRSAVHRPVVGKAISDWQGANHLRQTGAQENYTTAANRAGEGTCHWQEAKRNEAGSTSGYTSTEKSVRASVGIVQQAAQRNPALSTEFIGHDALRGARVARDFTLRAAQHYRQQGASAGHQDANRASRGSFTSRYYQAIGGHSAQCRSRAGSGSRTDRRYSTKYQNAMHPNAGKYIPPTDPGVNPGYIPTTDLLFDLAFTGSTNLLFRRPGADQVVPTETVIVPVRRAYIVVNNINLRRAVDNAQIPCYSLSMTLDADSWTWSFSATLHKDAMGLVEPSNYGAPVELDVEVNGAHYRVLVESISRERQFGSTRIAVSGRGKSAVLSDPYSPILTFSNSQMRSAQQLMNDALMDNGVSIGWEVDFGLADWSVPTGVFSHNGSYMSALKAIAEAAGGYIQPDPVLNKLFVKPRYPVAPWNWHTLSADYSLPSDVTARESISWVDKADYDAVYVSGVTTGVTALVRKQGTAGGVIAPMVVDPLITDDIAARQRGTAVLGNTGRIANVMLSLPILPATGIIVPGKIVDYVDGGVTRRGITRSVSISANMPTIRQSIEVETHVY